MFADGLLPLVEAGVVNGARKKIDRGKIVASFLMGSRRVFEFADRNRMVRMREVAYTNDPFRIARNPKVVAINSAIQIDLTGQVCADSLGTRMYSGVGGQLDFVYGASRSEGGKPVIAMPSRTAKGISKIVPVLDARSGGGDAPEPRPLRRNGVRRGRSLRKTAAGAGQAADQHRPPRLPRGVGESGV